MARTGRVVVAAVLAFAALSQLDNAAAGGVRGDRSAMVDDPTSNGRITRATRAVHDVITDRGLDGGEGIGCHAARPQNPDSDHPAGRACDVMFDPHSAASVRKGWRLARWLVRHDDDYGIAYVIWQGRYWDASQGWGPYSSPVYGCPNPANLTGCHYDHVHISVKP